MPVLGITGGIATGKSLVTRLFQKLGTTVFSADEAARAVLQPGSRLMFEIASAFGADVICADGSLHRKRLAEIIFLSPERRFLLETITHPPILRLLSSQIECARYESSPQTLVAVEVPLLYETHMESWFDFVLVVSISEQMQLARLCRRSNLAAEEARARIAAQMPLSLKIRRANFVIDNTDSFENTEEQVWGLMNTIERTRQSGLER